MPRHISILTGLTLLFGGFTGANGDSIEFSGTTKSPHDVELAFVISGRIGSVTAQPGMQVAQGQRLVDLDDRAHKIKLELHRMQADNDVDVRLARQQLELAKLDQRRRAYHRGSVKTSYETRRAQAARGLAELVLEQAQLRHSQAQQKYRLVHVQQEQHVLRAPVEGVIEQIHVSAGQIVKPGAPVLRLVANRTLWVDASIPTERTADLQVGTRAWIRPKPNRSDPPIEGKIVRLAQTINVETDTRLVRVQIYNDAGLLVGAYVTVSFQDPTGKVEARNPKSEIRNKLQTQNANAQNSPLSRRSG